MPDLPHGYLGAQPKFKEFGLTTLSHADPVISSPGNDLEVKIGFKEPVKTIATLTNVKDEKEYNEFIFIQTMSSAVSFVISMPVSGWWKLQLYALPASSDGQQLFGVYNYIVNCERVTKTSLQFPKQYAQWKEGCYLHEPLALHMNASPPTVRFKAHIPKVIAAAVVAGDEWTHLQQASPGLWEGMVNLGKYYGKNTRVTLNANYGGDKASYATMLEYKI